MLTWPAPAVPELPGRGGPVRVRAGGGLVVAAPGPTAGVYVCGITPYDATHLGHAATYVAFDLLVRAWRDTGLAVRHVSNVTDVDDPLLERARATGVDWRRLAAEQTALFAEDMTALRVLPPDVYTSAVESIPAVVEAVRELLALAAAYRIGVADRDGQGAGDVYADLAADPELGPRAGLTRAQMLALFAQRGGDPDRPGKRDPLDPLLWRAARPDEPSWPAGDLGPGRPGWHIECAVIARDGLGLPFDVQGGGADLAFPHHAMSSSHARLLSQGGCARWDVHTGMVGLGGEKMSKSLGNLVLVSQLRAAGEDPAAVRLALLAHHYAADWDWTSAELDAARDRLDRWRAAVQVPTGPDGGTVLAAVRAALAADLDAPAALAAVDAWSAAALADQGTDGSAGPLVARTVDALLGVQL